MAKEKLSDLLKGGEPTISVGGALAEGIKEGLGALLKGMGEVWDASARHAEHGAAELSSLLMTGNGYVPYGWSHAETEQSVEAPKTPEMSDGLER